MKNDPQLVAAAREVRDRWLEQVNADPSTFLSNGKYDVSGQIEMHQTTTANVRLIPLSNAA